MEPYSVLIVMNAVLLLLLGGLVAWVALNRHTLGAEGLHDRLDELEKAVATVLHALLEKLGALEDLVPHVNLTHNANPLQPLFEAIIQRWTSGNIEEPSISRDESGRFQGELKHGSPQTEEKESAPV